MSLVRSIQQLSQLNVSSKSTVNKLSYQINNLLDVSSLMMDYGYIPEQNVIYAVTRTLDNFDTAISASIIVFFN